MRKRLISIFITAAMIFAMFPASVSAASTDYPVYIDGYLEQSSAYDMLIDINYERESLGLEPLIWDGELEEYVTDRAAELSLLYSSTRPNGKKGEEWYHSYGMTASEFWDEIYYDEEALEYFLSPYITSFACGVFESYQGVQYIACMCGFEEPEDTSTYEDDEYTFTIRAKDGYLRLGSSFVNGKGYTQTATNLKKGSTYYYDLYNTNKNYTYQKTYFSKYYAKSSNTNVATIDKYGKVKALRAGYATLTIKPHLNSEKYFKKTVVVRPEKVTNVKVTSPKKKTAKITWNRIYGASGYKIYRSTSKNGTYSLIKTMTSGSTVSYTNTNLKSGKTYYYKVCGYVKYNNTTYKGTDSDKKYKRIR